MINPLVIFKNTVNYIKELNKSKEQEHIYRILEIFQDDNEEYLAHVQIINTRFAFHIRPEEVLADDNLVNLFSQRDIRTLTYLGYLGINSPKYKILAQRLVTENKIAFAISEKGKKNVFIKTAIEIMHDRDIITSMNPLDASTIGYAVASETAARER